MNLLFVELYPSSFRGATFWWKSMTQTGGRKTVVHEFPNKDFRFVEDIGKQPKTFEFTAIVKGFFYRKLQKELEKAMETPGLGVLTHPIKGNIKVYPITYTLTEVDTAIGVATYTLQFSESEENVVPRVTQDNTSIIANIYRDLYKAIGDFINAEWTLKFLANILDAVRTMERMLAVIGEAARAANSFGDAKKEFNEQYNQFNSETGKSAFNSELLAGNVTATTSLFDNLTTDQTSRFDINSQLFGFGSTDSDLLEPTTASLEEETKNRKLLNGSLNGLVLVNLYQTATLLAYEDQEQLNFIQNSLDAKYFELISNENFYLSNSVLNTISQMRNEARKFFDVLRITLPKITEIKVQNQPIGVLVYTYYGDTFNYQEILDLNNAGNNPAVLNGTIKILEEQQ